MAREGSTFCGVGLGVIGVMVGVGLTGCSEEKPSVPQESTEEQIERMIQGLGGEIQRVEVVTKSQTAQPAGERMAG